MGKHAVGRTLTGAVDAAVHSRDAGHGTPESAQPHSQGLPKPFLTLSGADERTDLNALAKLDAEIGLLYTATPDGRNRYPRWEWIREASLALPRSALHICGRGARAALINGVLDVGSFQRIQVNGAIGVGDVEKICAAFPAHTIITQHHDGNRELMAVRATNHAILVDSSGGQGVSPASWSAPDTEKPTGFAGGLGPANLESELRKIADVVRDRWWVDMEEKLRINDWFSTELASICAAQFRERSAAVRWINSLKPRRNALVWRLNLAVHGAEADELTAYRLHQAGRL